MTSADALEKLKQQFKGVKIDENANRVKVKKWATKDIQIGELKPAQIAEIIVGAFKQSYKEEQR